MSMHSNSVKTATELNRGWDTGKGVGGGGVGVGWGVVREVWNTQSNFDNLAEKVSVV